MKKKLLSLVLAGAMVASTSVSAFADSTISQTPSNATNPQNFSVTDTPAEAEVTIDGKIANGSNKLPSSTISVSVPTAASFTVDNTGKLIGSNITITSQSSEEVEVLAYRFNDRTGNVGINVVNAAELKAENDKAQDADRRKISLKLEGNEKAVSLITQTSTNTNGICKFGTNDVAATEDDKKIGVVSSSRELTLKLEGEGVTAKNATALADPVSDTFTLTLKLRKKTQ